MSGFHGDDRLDLQSVERAYRRYAPIYDLLYGKTLQEGRRRMCDRVNEIAPHRVLEIGVGTGLTLPLYEGGFQLVGIDLSMPMLRKCQVRASRCRAEESSAASVHLLRCDAQALSFCPNLFDCVVLPYVLSTVPNPRALMHEVLRVAKPGARILVLNHFSGAGGWALPERLAARFSRRIGFRTDLSLDDAFSGLDLDIEKVETVNWMGLSRLVEARKS